jgi:hypothetical protein
MSVDIIAASKALSRLNISNITDRSNYTSLASLREHCATRFNTDISHEKKYHELGATVKKERCK